ncbi:MAG: MFS transporter [Clostridia bacterium]|nr:MFS transporter [Clostridia bacterium]
MGKLLQRLNRSKIFRGLDEKEFSWVLYDVGNSAFTMLACSLIPIWFHNLADARVGEGVATAYFSLATSIITIIVAIIGPIFGALSDRQDKKKLFFSTAVALGVIGCVVSGFSASWLMFLVVYALARIFYSASLTFYDSMLGDVTTEERMDEVSSYGYAWGYIGSCIPFTLALIAYVLGPDMLGVISGFLSQFIGCAITGAWWFVVSLPLIKGYKQKNYTASTTPSIGSVFKKIGSTLKRIALEDRKVLFFLIAFFLYIDGVGTIIDNCINIGKPLGLDTIGMVVFLLATQVVAWIFSLIFAKLSKRYDTVKLLLVCITGYFFVCLYALTLHTLLDFAILAFGVGCFQGSIQSLSRSYFSKIIPPENSGEYFGIYDIFAKGASFLGSAVIAGVIFLLGGNDQAGTAIRIAVASLAVFFLLGFVFLKLADKQPSKR